MSIRSKSIRSKSVRSKLLCGSALALALAPAAHAQTTQQMNATIKTLQQQIQALEGQLQTLQGQVNAQAQQQAQTQAQVQVQAQTVQAQAQAQAKQAAAAAAPAAPGPKVTESPTHRFGFESADGQYSIQLTGRLHFDVADYANFHKDGPGTAVNNLSSGVNARRARLGVIGKFAGDWNYTFVYDFGGSSDNGTAETGVNTSGIEQAYVEYEGFNHGPVPLAFDIGYQDLDFTLEEAESSNDIMFMERGSIGVVAQNIFAGDFRSAIGVKSPGDRYWAGLYVTGGQSGEPHGGVGTEQQMGVFGRATYQVLQEKDASIHVGVDAGSLLKPPEVAGVRTITLSDRPELRVDPTTLLTTGALGLAAPTTGSSATSVKGAEVYGVEAAGGLENFFAQGEWYEIQVDRVDVPANHFDGGYIGASWTITGESRQYLPASASYGGITPAHPFSIQTGDWGAFELAGRVSFVNLNDNFDPTHSAAPTAPKYNGVEGGRQLIFTAGLNWYVNSNIRFMFDYLHGTVKKQAGGTVAGIIAPQAGANFDALAMRTQIAF